MNAYEVKAGIGVIVCNTVKVKVKVWTLVLVQLTRVRLVPAALYNLGNRS